MPQDAQRQWQKVTALADGLEEDEEVTALAVLSHMLQLDYAWRLGMDQAAVDSLPQRRSRSRLELETCARSSR